MKRDAAARRCVRVRRRGDMQRTAIDRLREVAGRLLRQAPEYQQIVREMGGTPAR